MRTLLRLFILGVILVFLGGCATFGSLTTPKYGELVMNYPDGDTIVYILPPEFPQLNEDEIELFPLSMIIWVAHKVIGDNIYGLFLWAPEAKGLGLGMSTNDGDKYWVYDAQGIPQPCTDQELEAVCEKWSYIYQLPAEPEPEAISL